MDGHGRRRHADGRTPGPRSHRRGRHRQHRVHCHCRLRDGPAAGARYAGVAGVRRGAHRGLPRVAPPRNRDERAGVDTVARGARVSGPSDPALGHRSRRPRPDAAVLLGALVERDSAAVVRHLQALSAGDERGETDHGGAGRGQPCQRRDELAAHLRELGRAGAGRQRSGVGNSRVARRDGGVPADRHRDPRARTASGTVRDPARDQDGLDAPARCAGSSRGLAGHARGRRLRGGHSAGGPACAGGARGASESRSTSPPARS